MKRIKLFALLAAAVIAFASCGKPSIEEDLTAHDCFKIHKGKVELKSETKYYDATEFSPRDTGYLVKAVFTVEALTQMKDVSILDNIDITLKMLDKESDVLGRLHLDDHALLKLLQNGPGTKEIEAEAYFFHKEDADEALKKTVSFELDDDSLKPVVDEEEDEKEDSYTGVWGDDDDDDDDDDDLDW